MVSHDQPLATLASTPVYGYAMGLPTTPDQAEAYFSRLYAVCHADDDATDE